MAGGAVVSVRFEDDTLLVLDGYARRRGLSRSAFVRQAVDEALAEQAAVLARTPPVVIHGEPAAVEEPVAVPLSLAPSPGAMAADFRDKVHAARDEKIRALRAQISSAEAGSVVELAKPAVREAARDVRGNRVLPPGYGMVNGRQVWLGEVDADGWPMGTEPA